MARDTPLASAPRHADAQHQQQQNAYRVVRVLHERNRAQVVSLEGSATRGSTSCAYQCSAACHTKRPPATDQGVCGKASAAMHVRMAKLDEPVAIRTVHSLAALLNSSPDSSPVATSSRREASSIPAGEPPAQWRTRAAVAGWPRRQLPQTAALLVPGLRRTCSSSR